MASIIKASNHLRCSLKEPGSRRAKSDATHVPPLAVAIGLGLVGAALVRRRADAYGMFALGFAIWCAVFVALAIFAALTAGDSSGSSTSYEPSLRP